MVTAAFRWHPLTCPMPYARAMMDMPAAVSSRPVRGGSLGPAGRQQEGGLGGIAAGEARSVHSR